MIDISDGLVQDLTHILKASKVGASLDLDEIPVSGDAQRVARTVILRTCRSFRGSGTAGTKNLNSRSFAFVKAQDDEALLKALSDGEDFELLFTVPRRKKVLLDKSWVKQFPKVPLTWIGRIEKGQPCISWCRDGKAIATPKLQKKGFSHF